MAKLLTTSYANRVDGYQQTFKQLRKKLLGEVAFVTELKVFQILSRAHESLLKVEDIDNLL